MIKQKPKQPLARKPPVITLDGPSGSGKGTISQLLAKALSWHLLDSGALYRILALAAQKAKVSADDLTALQKLVCDMQVEFQTIHSHEPVNVILNGEDITPVIRTEKVGDFASQLAALPIVRQALLAKQRNFRTWPGLVTDGRDMGTVVFPDATIKFYVTATCEERAKRRCKQLLEQGIAVKLARLQKELAARDVRDSQRSTAPLKAAEDAVMVDTTGLTIEQVFEELWYICQERLQPLNTKA